MVYGIIGALDEEIVLVKEKMTGIEEHILYGRSFYTGRIGQKDDLLTGGLCQRKQRFIGLKIFAEGIVFYHDLILIVEYRIGA